MALLAWGLIPFAARATEAEDADRAAPSIRDREVAQAGPIAFKFTPTYYSSAAERPAWDFNLRGSFATHNVWGGFYRRQDEFQQLRLGYDYTWAASFGKLIPSIQYATRGFVGGSVSAELGDEDFFLLGLGRTNLKPYYNLNFDPNDAITLGLGTRALPRGSLTLFQVRDDRLHTGQRLTHLVARFAAGDNARWTLDLFHKRGRADADPSSELLRGTGLTITYDFGPYFLRIASDPKANFAPNHMLRVAVGLRY
jgi:hypothetical protein